MWKEWAITYFRPTKLDSKDIINVIVLGTIAFAFRYWVIYFPTNTVFDECYFGNFTNYYINRTFYYDIHPPFGKMVMALFGYLSEYEGGQDFQNLKDGEYNHDEYVQLRLTPASLSALCIPLTYISMRFLSFSHISSFTAAFLYLCDTSLAAEGRHILSDGVLHFFSCLHIATLCYTISIINTKKHANIWHFINGLTLGMACSCKNTAWGLMAMDAVGYIIALLPSLQVSITDYVFDVGYRGITLFLTQFSVYLLSFYIHFIVLKYKGPGEPYLPNPMKEQLLKNSRSLELKRITGPGLFERTLWLAHDMHTGNMGIQEFHDSMSWPRHWPVLGSVGVYFWNRNGTEIRCIGNPFVYYISTLSLVALLVYLIATWKSSVSEQMMRKKVSAILILAGYSTCYFPFYLIPRVMYLYHYLIPLCLACMATGALLDVAFSNRGRGACAVVVCGLALAGWFIFSSYVYGITMHDHRATMWTRRWSEGDAAHRSSREAYYSKKNAK